MPDFPTIARLDSAAKCAALWPKYPEKVVGMWATGLPRQNVDVLWRLREELLKLDVPVIFFFRECAKPMLRTIMAADFSLSKLHIYQLDNAKFFSLLNFVDVLVSNDTILSYDFSHHIRAKLVGMPHHANVENPTFWNFFYDYFVSDKNTLSNFDYSFHHDRAKIHRNPYFTQLIAGHPKIDLILEERQKNTCSEVPPILLLYPAYVNFSIAQQNIAPEKYVAMWTDVISDFLAFHQKGLVVFRPTAPDRSHPLVSQLTTRFAASGRFFLDEDDDNKFWLARAKYFVTDYSEGYINFSMTAKRPVIRMVHSRGEGEEPKRNEWGWTISRPGQVVSLLQLMDREAESWTAALSKKQKSEMPTLGQNFAILAGMIKRILNNDDDPTWLKLDKSHTRCQTSADVLKLVTKWARRSPYNLGYVGHWLDHELLPLGARENSRIWLPLLRRALVPYFERDSPDLIAHYVNLWLENALANLPLSQSVGLLRHLVRVAPEKCAAALLITITSVHVTGTHKKRALFFLLVEWGVYEEKVLAQVNDLAKAMPQHFSRPVLDKLNRFLPFAMKVPLPLRRFAARILGLKKPLAKKYWLAHRALA